MSELKCKDISAYFSERKVLDGVSLTIESGGITGFIGPSGCGKSTLLKCFNRINDLSSGYRFEGDVLLNDRSVYNIPQQELRRKVCMVFQRPTPFAMSVYKNVTFGPKGNGIHNKAQLDEIVEKALRNASLWEEVKDRLHTSASGLSGGQQQRLCIARALAVSPDILLLDEPTSALDPISTARIEDLLLSLQDKLTMVLVSHNMRQVQTVCKMTAFFERGKLIEYGETNQIFQHPKSEKTLRYVKQ